MESIRDKVAIIGMGCTKFGERWDKSAEDLNEEFKDIMRRENAKLTIVFQVGNQKEVVEARGDPKLTFNHAADLVVRKSDYICPRTLAIKANKAAKDLSRHFVANLKNFQNTITVTLVAEATN